MICFRDMTFCEYHNDCAKAHECPRALTDLVKEAADKWWGKPGAPIAVFVSQPDCHTAVEKLNDSKE